MKNGNWGFPKGHTEEGESEKDTAFREVKEETGIDMNIIDNFRECIKYVPIASILKTVIFFLGTVTDDTVVADETEIEDFMWCSYEEAMKIITYKLQRDILEKALKFIRYNSQEGSVI